MSGGGWASSYHRMSDDSVSRFGGHPDRETALAEARENLEDADINETWVCDPEGDVAWKSRDELFSVEPREAAWHLKQVYPSDDPVSMHVRIAAIRAVLGIYLPEQSATSQRELAEYLLLLAHDRRA